MDQKSQSGFLKFKIGILAFMALFVILPLISKKCGSKEDITKAPQYGSQPPALAASAPALTYTVFKQTPLADNGFKRIVLIDSRLRNENDIKAIAEQLKKNTEKELNANVYIFDNDEAAAMEDKVANLSESQSEFYDKHFIAIYTRNSASKTHKLEIMLEGVSGKGVTVTY